MAKVLGLTQFCVQHVGNHKRCSGLGRLSAAAVSLFRCPACARGSAGGAVGVGRGVVGEVKQFCYLGDVLECGGGSERAIRAGVGAAWGKWEIASLLVNRGIPLHHRGKVYEACIRSVMLYGGGDVGTYCKTGGYIA